MERIMEGTVVAAQTDATLLKFATARVRAGFK